MNSKLQQARNENTPPQVLLKLIRHYPQTVLDNSTFAEVISNNPKFLAQLSRKSLLHLLKQDRVPVCFLEWLADSQDKKVLLGVLRHSNIPLTVLKKLSKSKFPEVVEEVKLYCNWQDKIDKSLEEILFTAVTNADIEKDKYKNCYSEKPLLKQLLAFGIVPDWTIPIFHETTKLKLANNSKSSVSVIFQLCKKAKIFELEQEYEFYSAIAKHPNTPSSILEQLISHESEEVRRLVISHPAISLTTIREYHQQQAITSLDINPEELRELAASNDLEIRLQVARNSKTPEDILVSFAQSSQWQLRLAIAFNLNTPVTTLEELIKDSYWEVRWAIAQNFSTSESILQELLKDKNARIKDVAERRLEDTSEEANKNSDIIIASNLIPSDIDAPDRIPREDILATEMKFAHNTYVKTLDLSKLSDVVRDVSSNNWSYRIYLLNKNTPLKILQQLADSEDKQDRSAVAYNQFTPTEILKQLVNDESEQIRIAVAENINSTEEILDTLADDKSKHVKNTVICNPNISLDILQRVIKQEKTNLLDKSIDYLVEKLLTGLQFNDESLNLLADIDRLEIKTALARLDNIPDNILEQLATSEHWQVKELVAKNNNVSLTALETLLQDNSNSIRNIAIEKLLEKNNTADNDFISQWNIVNNPDSDTATIDNLVNSKWLAIRIAVASSANTSSNILEQLARDSILDIRLAVGSNINTPISLLDDLLADNNIAVIEAVINNPSFPIERLEGLAAEKTYRYSKLAIKSLLQRGIKTASKYLIKYAQHSTPTWSRLITFFHPLTPKQFLIKNYRSHIWLERYAIAQNSNAPRQIVERLTQDGNSIVRDAAVNNLQHNNLTEHKPENNLKNSLASLFRQEDLSPEALETVAKLSSKKVLLAVANHPNTPKTILDKLVKHNNSEIAQAASLHINYRDNIPENWKDILEGEIIALIKSSYFNRQIVLSLPQLDFIPEPIFNKLLQEQENKKSILLVLGSSRISPKDIKKIANSADNYIRSSIAYNNTIPIDIIEQIVKEYNYSNPKKYSDYMFLCSVAKNFNTPVNILKTLAKEDNLELHQALIQNPNTPKSIKQKLQEIKQLLHKADNPDISDADLKILATSKYSEVRRRFARNYDANFSFHALEKLAEKQNANIENFSNPSVNEIINSKLAKIARNNKTSVEILDKLANNKDLLVRQLVAKNNNISCQILEKLVTESDLKILKAIANHPNAPVHILENLAKHPDIHIRIAAIKNINTPEYILEQLSEEIKNCGMYALEEIAQQPNMPLTILEKWGDNQYAVQKGINWLHGLALVKKGVAKNPKTPVSILNNIMQGSYSGAWEGIAVNPNTTVEMLEELVNYSTQEGITNDSVPVSVAKNPNTPVHLLEKLVTMTYDKKNKWTKANQTPIIQGRKIAEELSIALIKNPNLPLHFLEYFAQEDKGNYIRGTVAQNPRTPITILEELSKESNLYWYLLHNPELPSHIAEKIANDENYENKRSAISDNPYIPQSILNNLAISTDRDSRLEVAEHSNTSLTILSKLLGDINNIVRQTVRENPNTPASLIAEVKEAYYNANYSTSATELANLANTSWYHIHAAVANNINTSVATLEQITTDKISYLTEDCKDLRYRCLQTIPTLYSLANNPNTPETILEQLLTLLTNNNSEIVKHIKTIRIQQTQVNINRTEILKAISSHPNTSERILAKLSNNQDNIIRATVANHKNTSIALLTKLIRDNNQNVRKISIENYLKKYPQGLPEILKIYANNSQPDIARLLALLHPQIPEKILIKKSRSISWLERYAVTTNPNTPINIKNKLASDANLIVRLAATKKE